MKVLNRPMFRYGGPIKEGVMSGIREPRKNGGPAGIGLVGDQRYPKTNGREHHAVFLAGAAVPAALTAARVGAMRAIPAATRYARKGIEAVKNIFGSTKPFQGPVGSSVPGKLVASRARGVRIPSSGSYSGVKFTRTPGKTSPAGPAMGEAFVPNPFGSYLGGTISGKALMGLYKGATSPTAVGLTQKAGKAIWATAKDPLTIAAAAYYFYPDGTPKPDKELEMQGPPPPGGLGKLLEDTDNKAAAGSGVELSPKEKRAQQIEKYRDIMDIKGMNKAAAYDSLIAASQAVNQAGGDLKGAIRDGSLINQIIQSTSKAFDKPAKTKDAIDTLILKGEIEKDIKASDPSTILDAEYKRAKIAESKEKLNPSFNTLKAGYGKDNKGQSGIDLAAAEYSDNQGQTFKGNIISKSDFNEIKEDIKEENKKKNQFDDDITIITKWTNATIKGLNVSDGNYTVGDKIVTIKDNVVIAVE
jgi:hypothetical protein